MLCKVSILNNFFSVKKLNFFKFKIKRCLPSHLGHRNTLLTNSPYSCVEYSIAFLSNKFEISCFAEVISEVDIRSSGGDETCSGRVCTIFMSEPLMVLMICRSLVSWYHCERNLLTWLPTSTWGSGTEIGKSVTFNFFGGWGDWIPFLCLLWVFFAEWVVVEETGSWTHFWGRTGVGVCDGCSNSACTRHCLIHGNHQGLSPFPLLKRVESVLFLREETLWAILFSAIIWLNRCSMFLLNRRSSNGWFGSTNSFAASVSFFWRSNNFFWTNCTFTILRDLIPSFKFLITSERLMFSPPSVKGTKASVTSSSGFWSCCISSSSSQRVAQAFTRVELL